METAVSEARQSDRPAIRFLSVVKVCFFIASPYEINIVCVLCFGHDRKPKLYHYNIFQMEIQISFYTMIMEMSSMI